MAKLGIFAGHGGIDSGALGNGYQEKAVALQVSNLVTKILRNFGHTVINNRTTDVYKSVADNVRLADSNKVDLAMEIHLNWGNTTTSYGVETFYSIHNTGVGKISAREIVKCIADLGFYNRGPKTRLREAGDDYYEFIRETKCSAIIVETAFITDATDMKKYDVEKMASAIADGVMKVFPIKQPEIPEQTEARIVGDSVFTADQLCQFLFAKNSTPKISCEPLELATYFIDEGSIEGIRGDIAFCQSIYETGWFRFGGDVLPEQNNYCGLGATNSTPKGKGAWFLTPQIGVRAQIQHLKAYANREPLQQDCVDPRFTLVTRGSAQYWTSLNGKWAVPGTTYGQTILSLYKQLEEQTPQPPDITPPAWEMERDEAWVWAISTGLMDGTRPDDFLRRDDFATVLKRLYALIGERI